MKGDDYSGNWLFDQLDKMGIRGINKYEYFISLAKINSGYLPYIYKAINKVNEQSKEPRNFNIILFDNDLDKNCRSKIFFWMTNYGSIVPDASSLELTKNVDLIEEFLYFENKSVPIESLNNGLIDNLGEEIIQVYISGPNEEENAIAAFRLQKYYGWDSPVMVVYDHVLDKNNEYEGLYNENIEYIQGYTNKLSAQYYIIPGKIKWNYSQEFSNVDELVQKSKQIIDSKLELL